MRKQAVCQSQVVVKRPIEKSKREKKMFGFGF